MIVAGRKSPVSLYNPHVATMEADQGAYNQGDATGFIRLNALRLRTRSAVLASVAAKPKAATVKPADKKKKK